MSAMNPPTSALTESAANGTQPPDPDVLERPRRRRFSADYRLRILRQADACTMPCEVGALLRCEGLYSSGLANWRRQRDRGSPRPSTSRGVATPQIPPCCRTPSC
jgi:hypothetical protein